MPEESTGFTLGPPAGATLGGATGGTYGNQPTDTYRVRLTAPDGRRTDITAIESLSLVREHTAVSDIEVTVPRGPDLADYRFADLDLYYDNELLFQALVERLPGPGTDAEATLAGRGIGRRLARTTLSVSFDDATDWEAIADVWDRTQFQAVVTAPNSPDTVSLETTAPAIEILQKLHEQANMAFVIRHDEPGYNAESFKPDENVRVAPWTRVDDNSEYDASEYANEVVVQGKLQADGTRPSATATDSTEIDRAGRTIRYFETDPELTDTAACQSKADALLAEKTAADDLSGSIDITPTRVDPGYYYQIPEWNDAELPLSSVSYDISRGSADASLDINGRRGLPDFLSLLGRDRDTVQREVQSN